jgi:hypothetical protein
MPVAPRGFISAVRAGSRSTAMMRAALVRDTHTRMLSPDIGSWMPVPTSTITRPPMASN